MQNIDLHEFSQQRKTTKRMKFKPLLKEVSLLIFLFFSLLSLNAQQSEYVMKAVALEKIAIFVNWPKTDIQENVTNDFVIAVLGNKSFGDILEETYKNKLIKERRVKILLVQNVRSLTNCDILFIPQMRKSDLQLMLNELKGKAYLTVADTEGFAEAGCFINFYTFENKLRFEINQKAMTEAGFTVDYRLLRVSKVLNPITQ